MKLNRNKLKILEKDLGFSLVNFSECNSSFKDYGRSSMRIESKNINDELYLIKVMEREVANHYRDNKNPKSTYVNSIYSEYISCNIGKMLELNIQEVILGYKTHNQANKSLSPILTPCVACKDFCKKEERLIPFDVIFTGISEDEKINYNKNNIYDVLEVIKKQKFVNSDSLKEHFLDMFVFDSFIGNFDRHGKNWGIIENTSTNEYRIAPIFDCGSSLHPKTDRYRIKKYAKAFKESNNNIREKAFGTPVSYFKDENGKKLNYYEFLINDDFDCNCNIAKSILKIVPKIVRLNEDSVIDNLINSLKVAIGEERAYVITNELKFKVEEMLMPTLEISKELLNKEIDEFVLKDYSEFNQYNNKEKREFLSEIKNILEMQKLLIENNSNNFDTKDLYQRVDEFLESKNTKDMKAVLSYLEKNNFPINYTDHFKEKFRLEIEKSSENKEKTYNPKKTKEDEKVEKKKEFDISDKF